MLNVSFAVKFMLLISTLMVKSPSLLSVLHYDARLSKGAHFQGPIITYFASITSNTDSCQGD